VFRWIIDVIFYLLLLPSLQRYFCWEDNFCFLLIIRSSFGYINIKKLTLFQFKTDNNDEISWDNLKGVWKYILRDDLIGELARIIIAWKHFNIEVIDNVGVVF